MLATTLIDAKTLAASHDAQLVVLDCRFDLSEPAAGRRAYLASHIPGARHVDLNQDLAAPVTSGSGRHPLPQPDVLARRLRELGVHRACSVVVYDEANGSFAARAWWLLRWLGMERVAVLDGGFKSWLAAGHAVESGMPDHAPVVTASPTVASFTPQPDATAVASAAEVHAQLGDPQRRLIDARAAERYAGISEPIDPVAGHVPGALNHPFTANLGPDGRFLAPADLRRLWLDRLAGVSATHAIMMCGSGVTACHNLLALELAGMPGAKLYAGSWSEWIRDPANPVARGDTP